MGGKMYDSISLHELHGSNGLEGVHVGFQSHRVGQTDQEDEVARLKQDYQCQDIPVCMTFPLETFPYIKLQQNPTIFQLEKMRGAQTFPHKGRQLQNSFSLVQIKGSNDIWPSHYSLTELYSVGFPLQSSSPWMWGMLCSPWEEKETHFLGMVGVYMSSYPDSPRPFSLLKAWRPACCWAAAWSARCWNWSRVGTSLGPWGACAGGGSPGSPPVSAAWLAWCSLGPGSPARGWCDGSTPATGKSNDKKAWTEKHVKTTSVALISLETIYFYVCCQKDSATSRACKCKFASFYGSTFFYWPA